MALVADIRSLCKEDIEQLQTVETGREFCNFCLWSTSYFSSATGLVVSLVQTSSPLSAANPFCFRQISKLTNKANNKINLKAK